ncbi:MAG TPA: FixH family protein [Candidatus Acidoferrales bacterium]|nr:FixH family protein [Candidatus Acidoferrales bacterium]
MQNRFSLFAVCVLLLVSFGCKSKPAPQAQAASTPAPLQVTLDVPGPVKPEHPTTVRLHVTASGKPVENASVHGVQNMVTMDMGKTEMDFKPVGGGTYEAVTEFGMSGPWKIDVTVKDGAQTTNSQVKVNVVD